MKNLVAFYTSKGNTEIVAKEISKLIDGDLRKIETVRKSKHFEFVLSAISALAGRKAKLKPFEFSVKEYDNVFIGGQIWAGHSTPAINGFLDKADLTGKKVFIFLTQADDKEPISVFESIKTRVEHHGGNVIDTFFIQTQMNSVISPDVVRQPVADWIRKNNIV